MKDKNGRKKCVGWRISATNWIWLAPVVILVSTVLAHATGNEWINGWAAAICILILIRTFRLVGTTWYE